MPIYQLTPNITLGDGVSQGVLLIAELLNQFGLSNLVLAKDIHPELMTRVRHYESVVTQTDDVLIYHLSVGIDQPMHQWLEQFPGKRLLVYHNITPSVFFTPGSTHEQVCTLGRAQLRQWAHYFSACLADSDYNAQELHQLGYAQVRTLPLLLNINQRWQQAQQHPMVVDKRTAFRLLFVGRIAPNKCQHQLIYLLPYLQQLAELPIHLTLVGGVSSPEYEQLLRYLVTQLELSDRVHLLGKVDDADLLTAYQQADLFISLSEHEGFGIPLVEAMVHQIPVVAYQAGAIASTLGGAGLLLHTKHYASIAALLAPLITNPALRWQQVQRQNQRLQSLSIDVLREAFACWLQEQGLKPMQSPVFEVVSGLMATETWQIQGPADSDYSLAVVNRELAYALHAYIDNISVYITEGGGDYSIDDDYLQRQGQPLLPLLTQQPVFGSAHVLLRNLYPPRLTESRGAFVVLGPFGWEESRLPTTYVQQINQRAHVVLAMSHYVKDNLRHSGVRTPIVVTGLGVDHIAQETAVAIDELVALWAMNRPDMRLLHVSSAFPRKGIDVLIDAFNRAIAPWQSAQLIIKTFANIHNQLNDWLMQAGWCCQQPDVQTGIQIWKRHADDLANIVVIWQSLTRAQMRWLYEHSSALVAPTRGEGFGLPQAEAMWCGLPVITTDQGGQRDFCTPDTAWLIRSQALPARTHLSQVGSLWFEPDAAHLAAMIDDIYQQRSSADQLMRKAHRAQNWIQQQYTWDHVAQLSQQAIRQQQQVKIAPMPTLRLGMITTWNQQCGIASYSQFLCQHFQPSQWCIFAPKTSLLLQPDTAQVHRCWQQGQEDDLQELYRAIVQQAVNVVHIQFNFNFFRLNALGWLIEQLIAQKIGVWITLHATEDVPAQHGAKSLRQIQSVLNQVQVVVHSMRDYQRLHAWGIRSLHWVAHGVLSLSTSASTPIMPVQERLAQWKKTQSIVIASYGFLLPHKGVTQLIQAFIQLKAAYPQLKLLLLNARYPVEVSLQTEHACQAMIQGSPYVQDILLYTGYTQEQQALQLLAQTDLVVMPYQHTQESSSAAVRFALAANRPVLVTPLSIFDDVSSVVYVLEDVTVHALAQGVEQRLDAGDELANQRQQWLAEHDWRHISVQMWLKYQAFLADNHPNSH